jgi:uncharacterized protein YuzE
MQLSYDLDAGALYIKLSDAAVTRTVEVDDTTLVDLDHAGIVRGIEVTAITQILPLGDILSKCQVPPGEEAQLRAFFLPSPRSAPAPRPTLSVAETQPALVLA